MPGLAAASWTLALALAQTPDVILTPGAVVLLANKSDAQTSETVRRALANSDPLVRRAAARVTAVAHPEAFDALRSALENERDPVVIAEFVKDIMALSGAKALPVVEGVARSAGSDAVLAIAEWFARMDPDGFVSHLPSWAETPHIKAALTRIVRLAIECHPKAREAILSAWRPVASAPAFEFVDMPTGEKQNDAVLATPPGLAAQLLAATLTAAGCGSKDPFMTAVVLFRADGRPRSIDAPRHDVNDACRAALIATATISMADQDDPAQRPHQITVPLSRRFLACAASAMDPPVVVPGPFTEGLRDPRLVKEVKPNYTQTAMDAKLEGVVEFDVVVSATGCVASVRETRSLKPSSGLDSQALLAIIGWGFEPGQFGEKPVPTVVSIQLTFTLRR